jgi:hypothetical protein
MAIARLSLPVFPRERSHKFAERFPSTDYRGVAPVGHSQATGRRSGRLRQNPAGRPARPRLRQPRPQDSLPLLQRNAGPRTAPPPARIQRRRPSLSRTLPPALPTGRNRIQSRATGHGPILGRRHPRKSHAGPRKTTTTPLAIAGHRRRPRLSRIPVDRSPLPLARRTQRSHRHLLRPSPKSLRHQRPRAPTGQTQPVNAHATAATANPYSDSATNSAKSPAESPA